jgi:hypothetical protein
MFFLLLFHLYNPNDNKTMPDRLPITIPIIDIMLNVVGVLDVVGALDVVGDSKYSKEI